MGRNERNGPIAPPLSSHDFAEEAIHGHQRINFLGGFVDSAGLCFIAVTQLDQNSKWTVQQRERSRRLTSQMMYAEQT